LGTDANPEPGAGAIRRFLFIVFLALAGPAYAQNAAMTVSGVTGVPVPCKAGTGSQIVSVTASAGGTVVCAAANGYRTMWRITSTGTATLYCTDDNTVPTSSYYNFTVPPGLWTFSAQMGWVSPAALVCLSSSGTASITADAIQNGAP